MDDRVFEKIELLVLDVDGVLTDGRIILTGDGREAKAFNVHDGAGMKYWKRAGGKLAFLSGRGGPAVEQRARELDVDVVRLNAKRKGPVFDEILAGLGISAECTAAVGDDLTDLPVLRRAGLAVAVADAVEQVRDCAEYVTRAPGGGGAVREVVELILKRAGKWDAIMQRYLGEDEASRP